MNKSELIHLLRVGKVGTTRAAGPWTCDEVLEMWEQEVHYRDRRRFSLSVWPVQGGVSITISRRVRPARPASEADKILKAFAWAGVAVTVLVALSYSLLPRTVVQYDAAPTCWEWDRDNHTLSINNTLDQFEMAHEAYRRTGEAPTRLTECEE